MGAFTSSGLVFSIDDAGFQGRLCKQDDNTINRLTDGESLDECKPASIVQLNIGASYVRVVIGLAHIVHSHQIILYMCEVINRKNFKF